MNYYSEWDKDAAAWLRELIKAGLIPAGDVDERSITEVKAHELTNYRQAHFFAGIGGWPLAFRIAGVSTDEPADSGSCPCQPFSQTGKQMGFSDSRHLWPTFRRLENRRRSPVIYGEQVASKLGREWLSRVFSDLEVMGYAGSGSDLCSAGVGSPKIRQRLYWVGDRLADPTSQRCGEARGASGGEAERPGRGCPVGGVASADNERPAGQHALLRPEEGRRGAEGVPEAAGSGAAMRLGHTHYPRPQGRIIRWDSGRERAAGAAGVADAARFWDVAEIVFCRDEKWRRIESGSFPLAHGIPSRVGPMLTELRKLGRRSIALARANRNFRLAGYGNAINPFVAAEFVRAHREVRGVKAGGFSE